MQSICLFCLVVKEDGTSISQMIFKMLFINTARLSISVFFVTRLFSFDGV